MRSVLLLVLACVAAACSGPGGGAEASERDADRDGHLAGADCDDADPFVHPGANEYCDGVDNDCDGVVDPPDALGHQVWYRDGDADGFGIPGEERPGCDPGPGWADAPTDCDDGNSAVHPRVGERCNGRDDDCDGEIDEDPDGLRYVDADGDGHGDPNATAATCEGTAPAGDDCDDSLATVFPGAPELCDGHDNDCDGRPDAIEAIDDPPTWYADLDGDGYGVDEVSVVQCVPPNEAWALAPGDCDDLDAQAHPGAVQRCVARDTDCDGQPGDADGWFAPEAPVRIPLVVTGTGASGRQPVTATIDYRAALDAAGVAGAFDPASVVVAVQDCAAGGAALATAAVDGLGDVLAGGDPTGTDGDEAGLLAFVLDRDLAQGEALPLAVYLGAATSGPGALSATVTSIDGPLLSATFDPDRGGTVDALVNADGIRVSSQADAREGNGIRSAGSWTQLAPATPRLVAGSPAFAAVAVDGVHAGTGGDLRIAAWWFVFDGVPALYGRLLLEADSDLVWDDPVDPRLAVRPFEGVPLDLVAPVGADGPDYGAMVDAAGGIALAWVDAPHVPVLTTCDGGGCSVAASEGQGIAGAAVAGERLVDHRLLVAVPLDAATVAGGPAAISAQVRAVRELPTVVAGAPEPRPGFPLGTGRSGPGSPLGTGRSGPAPTP